MMFEKKFDLITIPSPYATLMVFADVLEEGEEKSEIQKKERGGKVGRGLVAYMAVARSLAPAPPFEVIFA